MLCCSFELKKHCIKISSFMSSLLYLNIYSRADWFREEEHLLIPSLSVFMSSMQTLACTDCPFSKVLVLLLHCTIMDNNKCATLLLSPIIRMAKLRATSLLSQETLPLPLPLLPLQPVTSPVGRTLWNTLVAADMSCNQFAFRMIASCGGSFFNLQSHAFLSEWQQ